MFSHFYEVMEIFKILISKILSFNFHENKRASGVKEKSFSLVSKMLYFRLQKRKKKQKKTSKNVADTISKIAKEVRSIYLYIYMQIYFII